MHKIPIGARSSVASKSAVQSLFGSSILSVSTYIPSNTKFL